MPLVTVLMPTFKQEAFIARAIESLVAQELSDWELLIVDDGSPDDDWPPWSPSWPMPEYTTSACPRTSGWERL